MYKADTHSHSHASPDGHGTVSEMALSAISKGLSELYVTDHCECHGFFERDNLPDDVLYYNYKCYESERQEAIKLYGDRIRLPRAVEIAQGHESPDVYRDILRTEFDFVIGSLHNLRGETDFYYMKDFHSVEYCNGLLKRYISELFETIALGGFDVLAHLTYPLRYMKYKYGFDVSLDTYRAEISDMFRTLIGSGRGIELNISGLRGGNVTYPGMSELKLYRSLGGEIITVGTDAHKPEDVGAHLDDGYAMLREAGFKYYTLFHARKPEFIPLD